MIVFNRQGTCSAVDRRSPVRGEEGMWFLLVVVVWLLPALLDVR